MARKLDGIDEFRDSQGVLFAPLGFGFSQDWERIARREVSGAGNVDIFWDDNVYDEIEVIAQGITVGTDARDLRVQFSTDGSTFVTSANYTWVRFTSNTTPASSTGSGVNDTSFLGILSMGTSTDEIAAMSMRIFNVSNTTQKKMVEWGHAGRISDNLINRGSYAGQLNASNNSIRGVRLFGASSATISGVIAVRGRRKFPRAIQSQDDWVVIDDQAGISGVTTHDVFWDDQVWNEIEITIHGLVLNTDNIDVDLLFSTDGSTFHNSAGNYKWSFQHSDGTPVAAVAGSNSDSRIRAVPFNGTGTDEHFQAKIVINNVANTTRKKTTDFTFGGLDSGGLMQRGIGAGAFMANNNSIRGFRLDPASTATMSADRIRVRGRRLTPSGAQTGSEWEVISSVILAANQATIPFTNIPSHEFDEFELVLKNVDTDTSGNSIGLQFSADNGSSYDTGTNYERTGIVYLPEGADSANDSTAASSIFLIGQFGSAADRLANGKFVIGPLDSGGRKVVWGSGTYLADAGAFRGIDTFGDWEGTGSTGVVTAFRLILINGGNFTAGSRFILRGRRKG